MSASDHSESAESRGGREVPPSELSYTEATRELEAIVEFFEQREVDVDQLVARLERATAIVDELDRRIHQTRTQVEELVPKLEAVARERDEGAGDASEESTGPRGTAHQSSDEGEPLF